MHILINPMARLPPAESPESIIFEGVMPSHEVPWYKIQQYACQTSSRAAGKGHSGARR